MRINGTLYTKLGKTGHADQTEPLGFREIKTQYTRLRPQIARQHDSIFLLGEPEATVAEVFKLLGRTDVIAEAQVQAKRDRLGLGQREKIRTEDEEVVSLAEEIMRPSKNINEQYKALVARVWEKDTKVTKNEELRKKMEELDSLEALVVPLTPKVKGREKAHIIRLIDEAIKTTPLDLPPVPRVPSRISIKTKVLERIEQALEIREGIKMDQRRRRGVEEQIEVTTEERLTCLKEMGICPTCEGQIVG